MLAATRERDCLQHQLQTPYHAVCCPRCHKKTPFLRREGASTTLFSGSQVAQPCGKPLHCNTWSCDCNRCLVPKTATSCSKTSTHPLHLCPSRDIQQHPVMRRFRPGGQGLNGTLWLSNKSHDWTKPNRTMSHFHHVQWFKKFRAP